jgi:hypothetical protein
MYLSCVIREGFLLGRVFNLDLATLTSTFSTFRCSQLIGAGGGS